MREFCLLNLFHRRQKIATFLDILYISVFISQGRKVQCLMANFLCAVTWRTHEETREHEDTCCSSPELFVFYNEEELE